MLLYEEMINCYSDSHPFLLVRLADLFVLLKSGTLASDLYRRVSPIVFVYFNSTSHHPNQAQGILSSKGVVDSGLDALVRQYALQVDHEVKETLAKARESHTSGFSSFKYDAH